MKKAISTFLVFISTCLLAFNLFGQEMKVNTQLTKVIANGGLRLREKPGTSSKILTTIPFGEKVRYLSAAAFGTDSIVFTDDSGKTQKIPGCWVNVSYKNWKGYVLNVYLYYSPTNSMVLKDGENEDFLLLLPGAGCVPENIHNPVEWKWYGYFEDTVKGTISVKPVSIRYLSWNTGYYDLEIAAEPSKNLKFIIGSKNEMPVSTKLTSMKILNLWTWDISERSNPDLEKLPGLSLQLVPELDTTKMPPVRLLLIKDGKQQLLFRPEFGYPRCVFYCGDIDNDGKNDYIINYDEKSGYTVLYLSSKARPGELVRPVAVFFTTYCC